MRLLTARKFVKWNERILSHCVTVVTVRAVREPRHIPTKGFIALTTILMKF